MKFLKKLALNKKGSEVVEKIMMVVLSIGLIAFAIAFIVEKVSDTTKTSLEAASLQG